MEGQREASMGGSKLPQFQIRWLPAKRTGIGRVVAPSVPYPGIFPQKDQMGLAEASAVPLGVRFGFKLQVAVHWRSVQAQEVPSLA